MRCSHCNQVLRSGATFCSRCGVPVRAASPEHRPARARAVVARDVWGLDARRVAGIVGGALIAFAAFLPWTHPTFMPSQNAFDAAADFPLGVILLACGAFGAVLSFLGAGERWRRGAASVAAAVTAAFVVTLDGGVDGAQGGAAMAVVGAIALAASVPVPKRSPNPSGARGAGVDIEEVV